MISSHDLANRGGIQPGMVGVDLCCCTGAGMRFLVRFRNVAHARPPVTLVNGRFMRP